MRDSLTGEELQGKGYILQSTEGGHDVVAADTVIPSADASAEAEASRGLAARVEELAAEVATLRTRVEELAPAPETEAATATARSTGSSKGAAKR